MDLDDVLIVNIDLFVKLIVWSLFCKRNIIKLVINDNNILWF